MDQTKHANGQPSERALRLLAVIRKGDALTFGQIFKAARAEGLFPPPLNRKSIEAAIERDVMQLQGAEYIERVDIKDPKGAWHHRGFKATGKSVSDPLNHDATSHE